MHFTHLLLSLFFLRAPRVVLPQGIPFLMQQGNPHLDHNDRSSPTVSLELECPLLKPCMGYYECVLCVCVPARLSADSYATVPCPRQSPASTPPQLPFTKSSCRPLGLLYLPERGLWMDGGVGDSLFYFGLVASERDSYCYCCEGLFSVSSDLSELHGIVIQLCQHGDC